VDQFDRATEVEQLGRDTALAAAMVEGMGDLMEKLSRGFRRK